MRIRIRSGWKDAVPGEYNGSLVAEHDGRQVGCLEYQTATGEPGFKIAMLNVAPEYQGREIGSHLLMAARCEMPDGRPDLPSGGRPREAWPQLDSLTARNDSLAAGQSHKGAQCLVADAVRLARLGDRRGLNAPVAARALLKPVGERVGSLKRLADEHRLPVR